MKKLPQYIKVKISLKDVKESSGYLSNNCCFLATALKRIKKFKSISVGSHDATIDGTEYVMSNLNSDRLTLILYNQVYEKKFKPFVVTLSKRKS